jgi:hypothetical protein
MSRLSGKYTAAASATPFVKQTKGGKEIASILQTMHKIEEKNRCVRVRFLDWLSAKLANWSARVKQVSDNIDSPCMIKVSKK